MLPEFNGEPHALESLGMEFVNIREQCAWVHADDPERARAKALTLIAAAVSRLRGGTEVRIPVGPVERSALILGSGGAASAARQALKSAGIPVVRVRGYPPVVMRANGKYVAARGDQFWGGQALIIAPKDAQETERLLGAFESQALRPRVQLEWGGLETHRPGVFFCDPELDPKLSGKAAAARAAAWLGRIGREAPFGALVDPARCRACGACVEICEFGAPELVGEPPLRAAEIDPVICSACGTCAAHCPSCAISLPNGEGANLETTLASVLAMGD